MAEHKNIYMALVAAQSEFGKVTKGVTNPAFKSKYADLADVASVVIPVMNAHGCAVLHYMVQGNDGPAMRTEFVHAGTEGTVSCDVPLIVDKNNMQGMKSATTYAKRIGLESLSGIAPEDDDGNAAAKSPPKAAPVKVGDADITMIQHLVTATKADVAAILKATKVESLPDMTPGQAAKVIEKLEAKLADMAKTQGDAKQAIAEAIDDEIPY